MLVVYTPGPISEQLFSNRFCNVTISFEWSADICRHQAGLVVTRKSSVYLLWSDSLCRLVYTIT